MSQGDANDPPDPTGDGNLVTAPTKMLTRNSSSLYLDVRMPYVPGRSSNSPNSEDQTDNGYYDPADKVQSLISQVKDPKHKTKLLFVEMDVLTQRGEELEWREWARWVKYEEKVEDGGKRWSKPHVASLSMHALMELRKHLLEGVFLPDIECYSISQVVEQFLDAWIATKMLNPNLRKSVRALCLRHHRHRHEKGRPEDKKRNNMRRGSDIRRLSAANLSEMRTVASAISLHSNVSNTSLDDADLDDPIKRQNERFLRKIPKGSEVANVMVAEVEGLDQSLCGLLRLNDPRILGDLSEVSLPTRFVFFLLGPKGSLLDCQEGGRCISTMLVDEVFREVVYKARKMEELVAGVDEFLEQVTVLPPGEWDPKIRIEPPSQVPDQDFRKVPSKALLSPSAEDGGEPPEDEEGHCDPDLVMSGRPFGGLIKDIKTKLPWYWSDFKDVLHIQCLASFVYIFLATLTPNVTFGGLLGTETDQYMGVMECILAAAVTGVGFALFAGQPLNILGSTGPMLVLEKIIYQFCDSNDWEFLPFRFWIGIWTSFLLLLIVAFDLSALVRYITRFTEEGFASLIALIFIYEAFKKMVEIAQKETPVQLHPDGPEIAHCYCNYTPPTWWNASLPTVPALVNVSVDTLNQTQCASMAGVLSVSVEDDGLLDWVCNDLYYVPDAFMFSVILFVSTFFIATFLVEFRSWPCFPSFVRQILGDFAVLIAILSMVGVDAALGLPTPKLIVPDEFKPTRSDVRDWVVNPVGGSNPWWLALAAGLPALLATILVFMDQQITSVIVNRKENKLEKGKGYHLDLLVVCILIAINSLLGLPWYVAATVSAIAHVNSLKKQSECTAPGERPTFLGVREQRVTALAVGILSGASVFITNVLKVIPMPVLYGVFFYMGWSALKGMQFIDRILLLFMPVKYQPDYIYLRKVPLWRVHIFTFIQIVCLAALWAVKSIDTVSIVFPLLVVFTGVVRKLLEFWYTQFELKYLDDILPSTKKGKKKKDMKEDKASDAKISAIIADAEKHYKEMNNSNGKALNGSNGNIKPSFFLNDEQTDNLHAYDNGGVDTKL